MTDAKQDTTAPIAKENQTAVVKQEVAAKDNKPASKDENKTKVSGTPQKETKSTVFAQDVIALAAKNRGAQQFLELSLKTLKARQTSIGTDEDSMESNDIVFQLAHEAVKDDEMRKHLVKEVGVMLGIVPEDLRTEELCKLAVTENGQALKFVPETLKKEAMCKIAVQQNGLALEFVPGVFKTEELCLTAITSDPQSLEHIPENLKNKAFYLQAVYRNADALDYVPEDIRTPAFREEAKQKDRPILSQYTRNFNEAFNAIFA